MSPLGCQIPVFPSSLICPFRLSSATSDVVVLSSDRQKMRTAPRWCRQHCAAQDAPEEQRDRREFPFLLPTVFIYLAYLYVHFLPPPELVLGQGWMTHVASHVS